MKSWPRYCQITRRKSFWILTFFVYYWIKNLNTQGNSAILRSTQEHLWALMGTDKYCAKALWVVMVPWCQAHQCSLEVMSAIGTMAWHHARECSWLLISAHECSWMLNSSHEHTWEWHHEHSLALMITHGPSWALISTHKHSWAFISSHEQSWAWPNSRDSTHEC